MKHFVFALCIVTLLSCAYADELKLNIAEKTNEILDSNIRSERYDKRTRPVRENDTVDDPTLIDINFYLLDVVDFNEKKMQVTLQMYIRQKWVDPRLQFDDMAGRVKYLPLNDISRIWTPDLFIVNEVEARSHNVMRPNEFIRIKSNGEVIFSKRLTLTLSCAMNFQKMPFDVQVCPLNLESYSHTSDQMLLSWKANEISINTNIVLPNFKVEMYTVGSKSNEVLTGRYSNLVASFYFKRYSSSYMLSIYIPITMMLVLSWCSLWFDQKQTSLRLLIGLSSLLSICLLIHQSNTSIPQTSYVKALDVWTGSCTTLAFLIVIETVVVAYMTRRMIKEGKRASFVIGDDGLEDYAALNGGEVGKTDKTSPQVGIGPAQRNWLIDVVKSRTIDVSSRIAFPLAFVVLNIIYWFVYLFGSQPTANE